MNLGRFFRSAKAEQPQAPSVPVSQIGARLEEFTAAVRAAEVYLQTAERVTDEGWSPLMRRVNRAANFLTAAVDGEFWTRKAADRGFRQMITPPPAPPTLSTREAVVRPKRPDPWRGVIPDKDERLRASNFTLQDAYAGVTPEEKAAEAANVTENAAE